jgi:hypothetical protein
MTGCFVELLGPDLGLRVEGLGLMTGCFVKLLRPDLEDFVRFIIVWCGGFEGPICWMRDKSSLLPPSHLSN